MSELYKLPNAAYFRRNFDLLLKKCGLSIGDF